MAEYNRIITFLFVFLTQVFDGLDIFGAIFSLCHGCNWALCLQGEPPVVFVPLSLVPRGNIRPIFIRYLVQMSASVFGHTNCLFEIRGIDLALKSLKDGSCIISTILHLTILALRISFPVRASWRDSFKKNKIRCG